MFDLKLELGEAEAVALYEHCLGSAAAAPGGAPRNAAQLLGALQAQLQPYMDARQQRYRDANARRDASDSARARRGLPPLGGTE